MAPKASNNCCFICGQLKNQQKRHKLLTENVFSKIIDICKIKSEYNSVLSRMLLSNYKAGELLYHSSCLQSILREDNSDGEGKRSIEQDHFNDLFRAGKQSLYSH